MYNLDREEEEDHRRMLGCVSILTGNNSVAKDFAILAIKELIGKRIVSRHTNVNILTNFMQDLVYAILVITNIKRKWLESMDLLAY